uniref:Ig-like domain-containing protein n=1 Tax=Sparus aurata TaxID=8175 RepID=A0A671WEX3_SPAAU
LLIHLFLCMFSSSSECKGADRVMQPTGDVIAAEGDTVTLDCKFETSDTSPYLFWYKQDGNNSPKFILSRIQRDEGNAPDEFKERFSSTLDSTSKSGPLKIQKLQLSDSAVYYCAGETGLGPPEAACESPARPSAICLLAPLGS